MRSLRQPTLETLGLGTVLEIFQRGQLPTTAGSLVNQIFGNSGNRGAMVISGANGIVGAGKTMQLGSRLLPFDVPLIGLDFPGANAIGTGVAGYRGGGRRCRVGGWRAEK